MVKRRELIRALERIGFRLLRKSKGSHWQFEHPDGRRTT
jgi:predicted RNA binding protein YcfA (HicA-like mRNA interferase family)